MPYLVSVVVPTKNRYFYLKHLINLIDSFKFNDLELVIQDNSDNNNEILEFLSRINNLNIKYYYSNESLSMSENSNLAVLNSTGEFVCFIGDDDGICRNILDCAKWMKINNIDSIRTPWTAYRWGNYSKVYYKRNLEKTLVYNEPKLLYKFVNPLDELNMVLNKGFQSLENLPLLYNGIVKRSILNKVYELGGTFFPGGSPDISNAVCLCFFVKKHVYVDIPVIISGTSEMTGGGIYKRKKRTSSLNDVGFIAHSVIDNWEESIPRIWVGRFAWPESGIKALRYVNRKELINLLNFNYLFAATAVYYKHLFFVCYRHSQRKIKFLFYILIIFVSKGYKVVNNKIVSFIFPNRSIGMKIKKNVLDMIEAERILFGIVSDKKFINL